MAYATLSDAKARAGGLASAWSSTSKPSTEDIEEFLDSVAAEIDALIGARGYTAPAAGSPAALALRNVNADGALALAFPMMFPDATGPASAPDAVASIVRRYEKAWDTIAAGKHPAFALLESGGSAPSASSFWQEEGDSFGLTTTRDPRDRNPFTSAGPAGRGQRF